MVKQGQDIQMNDDPNHGRVLWKKATDMYKHRNEEKRIHPDSKLKSERELIAEAVEELDAFLKSEEGQEALDFLRESGNFVQIFYHEPEEENERKYITLGLFKDGFHLRIGGLSGVFQIPSVEEVLEIWTKRAMHKPEDLMPFIRRDLDNAAKLGIRYLVETQKA